MKASLLAAVAGFLMFPAPALAAEDDTQLWLFLSGVVPLDDDLTAIIEVSPRSISGADQLLVRGNADWRITPRVELGGGASWVQFAGGREFRPHQQVQLTHGPVQFRTRVEERFFAGADRAQIRLRQRVQLTVPLAEHLRGIANAELLYIARPQTRTGSARVDSWRGSISASYRLSSHADVSVGYLAVYSPRAGARDRLSHVPQLRLTVR